jgi:hypothetical protein
VSTKRDDAIVGTGNHNSIARDLVQSSSAGSDVLRGGRYAAAKERAAREERAALERRNQKVQEEEADELWG